MDTNITDIRAVSKPLGLPAKDRSGRLDETEPPDLLALLRKINAPAASPA